MPRARAAATSPTRQSVLVDETDERSIDELIDSVPWGRLTHAYDFALDAPVMLHAQVDATELDPAFDDWLFSAVTHQGTTYSATAPVLWLLRRIVTASAEHPALGLCLSAVAICADAIGWIDKPAQNLSGSHGDDGPTRALYRNPEGDPPWASVMPPGYRTKAKIDGRVHDDYFEASFADVDTLRVCVADWHPTIVRCLIERDLLDSAVEAAAAAVQLWRTGPVADALTALVRDESVAELHRAGALYALSRAGRDVGELAGTGERGLQFAFALGQPDAEGNLETLVDALGDLPWLSRSFPHGLPGAEPWLIPAVVAAVLDQAPVHGASDRVVDALVGVAARPSGPFGATYEWGPVLAWAFPDRVQKGVVQPVPPPESLTPTQERLLVALVGNDKVWEPRSGNDSLALKRVGLPHDRAAVASLLQPSATQTRSRWWRRP